MLLDRTSNPREEFDFRAESFVAENAATENVAANLLQINNMSLKVRESIEPIVECAGKQATIFNISRNQAWEVTVICMV